MLAPSSPPSSTISATSVVDATDSSFERDRGQAIAELCKAAACEALLRHLRRRRRPRPAQPVQRLRLGHQLWRPRRHGLRLEGSATAKNAFSVVIVTAADVDGFPPFDPVTVEDDDPTSPTHVSGNFGRVLLLLRPRDRRRRPKPPRRPRPARPATRPRRPAQPRGDRQPRPSKAATSSRPSSTTERPSCTSSTASPSLLTIDGTQSITTRSVAPTD